MNHLTHVNPPSLSDSLAVGYSQAVRARPGELVFLAGQVGWDAEGKLAGDGSFSAQAAKALQNVALALAASGAGPNDVTHIKYFVVGCTEERVAELSKAIREAGLFSPERPPTGTLIGVDKLARDELLVEIEAIAVIAS